MLQVELKFNAEKCLVPRGHKGRFMIHQESLWCSFTDPKGLIWYFSNASCDLSRPGSHKTVIVIVIGREAEGERIPAAVPHNFFLCYRATSSRVLTTTTHLCLLLEHHCGIDWVTLNIESRVVSGRIYTNVVRL